MPRWFRVFRRSTGSGSMGEDASKPPVKSLARNMVPDVWLREREIYLRLGEPAGRIYAGLRLRDKF